MMKTKELQTIALFMVCLVISLPLYSAQAFAAITAYSVNKEGVKGYRAVTDKLTIVAEIDKAGVSPSDINLVSQRTVKFGSCKSEAGKSICTYEFAQNSAPPGKVDYSVRYGVDVDSNSIVVDDIAPNITITSLSSAEKVKVKYSVKERAFKTDQIKCSSIKTINFLLTGTLIHTLQLNFTPGDNCDYNDVTEFVAPSTNGIEKSFCIEILDNVGNTGQTCQNLLVDKEAAIASNPELINLQGLPINYVSAKIGPISAKIRFTLTEQNVSKVIADASEFSVHDIHKQAMKGIDITQSCTPKNCKGSCTCEVPITLSLPQGGNPVLRLVITDASNNNASLSLPVAILPDNTPPKLVSLVAKQCGTKNAIGPKRNTMTANIEEAESGISARKIYLDLSPVLGLNWNRVFPNECVQAESIWTCRWGIFDVTTNPEHGSNLKLNLVTPSQDNAGNFLESTETTFFYDSRAPAVSVSTITGATQVEFGVQITAFPVGGGTLELNIETTDDVPVTATADFSHVAPVGKKTVECSGDGTKKCSFKEIGPLYSGPLFDQQIPVTFTDCAGNTNTAVVKVNISALETGVHNQFAYVPGSPSPARIERQSLRVFDHRAYVPIAVSAPSGVNPILQKIVECTPSTATNYLAANLQGDRFPDLIGAPSKSLHAKFNFQRAKSPPDTLAIACKIQTIGRSTGGVIFPPELDDVSFTFTFYDSPLGSIDENTRKKVDEVKNSALVQGKWIKDLENVFNFIGGLCNLYNYVAGIPAILSGISAALGLAAIIFPPLEPASLQVNGVSESLSGGITGLLGGIMTPLCQFHSCNVNFGIKEFGDWQKAVNSYTSGAIIVENLGPDLKPFAEKLKTSFAVNPRESIILSAVTLCVPGMIYNLQKARQIECAYLYCVNTYVAGGVPLFFCDAQRAYGWCRYVVGEIFSLVPFGELVNTFVREFVAAMTTWVGLINLGLQACIFIDKTPGSRGFCRLVHDTARGASVIADLFYVKSWEGLFKPAGDYCEEVLK